MKHKVSSPFVILLVVFAAIAICHSTFNAQSVEGQTKKTTSDANCLADDKPKPEVKVRLGVLNGKTKKMPRPVYPAEAKRRGISGEVRVEVVIDLNTGVIEWARMETGDPLLQEAVSKVICKASFFQTNDVDARASGYLTYTFPSPQKFARRSSQEIKRTAPGKTSNRAGV